MAQQSATWSWFRTSGRTVETVGDTIVVATDATNPIAGQVAIGGNDVERIMPSSISPMPDGLLNTLTKEGILDLLAYLIDH